MRDSIIDFLNDRPDGAGMGEISQGTGHDKDKLKILLVEMKDKGEIITTGKARGTRYLLAEDRPSEEPDIQPSPLKDTIRSMVERTEYDHEQWMEDNTDLVDEMTDKGMNILRISGKFYKLSFLTILENNFQSVDKKTIRSVVQKIIDRDDVELRNMTVVYVG